MCIDKDFTIALLKNMIRNLEVAHDLYDSNVEICHNQCEEFFLSYELLVQHMKGVYTKVMNKDGKVVRKQRRDWDALIMSIGKYIEDQEG